MLSAPRLFGLLPLGLALLLTTGACTRTPDTANGNDLDPTPGTVEPVDPAPSGDAVEDTERLLALSGDGLQLVGDQTGAAVPLPFGADIDFVDDTLTQLLGDPVESGLNEECGSGPQIITQWPNGMVIYEAEGEFIGWGVRPATDSANLTTMAGIGIGSTLADLEAAYTVEVFESTLGIEFAAGALAGLLTADAPDGTITDLWAGTTCIFR
ncbi:hypothetical protein [Nodosilinea sp. P-1105]|uniref:hypothetical protein n=1 Tax=Nodosilinea sp. P-1105 TaxID=2546229 RepID=UPI00146CACDA|nr:hypothetical protein [Nodosilinea sp. P-1105]NMF85626.1 hypothetical protein [Nodosilinea sp. P-1105]